MKKSLLLAPLAFALNASAQVVINEVDYDQVGTDNQEYLEIKNVGTIDFPLQFLTVEMYNGSTGTGVMYRTFSDPAWPDLGPGQYFVICTNAGATAGCNAVVTPATNLIQNGPSDAIVLVLTENPTPLIIDMVSYGGSLTNYAEGTGTTAVDVNSNGGISIGRWPDGADTQNNNADFRLMCTTPGATNVIDPVACDLSTGVLDIARVGATFTALLAPGGEHIMVFDPDRAGERPTFDVFTVDGSLVASSGVAASSTGSWTFPVSAHHGSMLLIRLTTPTRQETRRVIVP
ncbi:MAG: lamin tail domain-containing protein [Flavobacteriales bacterium]|nr:lamin tail domain-containing protein [Flavobacteriales bacterium]